MWCTCLLWVVTAREAGINVFCFEMLMKFRVILTAAAVAKRIGLAVGESGCVCSSALKFSVIFAIKLLWLGVCHLPVDCAVDFLKHCSVLLWSHLLGQNQSEIFL